MSETPSTLSRIGTFLGVLLAFFGVVGLIDWRVRAWTGDPSFLSEVAGRARASAVFDDSERVLADGGAFHYIEKDISVEKLEQGRLRITVSGKQHLAGPPILETLDEAYSVVPSRGKGFDWVFDLEPEYKYIESGPVLYEGESIRFRIEVFPALSYDR